MIALVDYGIGNLRSVEKALATVGAEVQLTSDPAVILSAEKVVLPGVGAFGDGMAGLRQRGLVEVIKAVVDRQAPLLGICVGMQVLFEESEEHGRHVGLGLLPGCVRRFDSAQLKIPQTGWNQIWPESRSASEGPASGRSASEGSASEGPASEGSASGRSASEGSASGDASYKLLDDVEPGAYVYFNHGYYCDAADADVLARTDYGVKYASIVGRGRLYGIQFHPEKSQRVGLAILRNFVERG
ncbi:MAG TPA: imidazole glycerol phosphate synthase subunit HisH [Anaerolineae bacterium]|nr:imidazole glycerol phosphate synthase subunit HisH [Anaerolineae bacterium]